MKTVRLTGHGGSLNLHDEPLPDPGRYEVLVRVQAPSLNFRDQAILDDNYGGMVKKDVVPLSDGAGDVVAVGPEVTRVKVGDRVTANCLVHWIGGPYSPEYQSGSIGFGID